MRKSSVSLYLALALTALCATAAQAAPTPAAYAVSTAPYEAEPPSAALPWPGTTLIRGGLLWTHDDGKRRPMSFNEVHLFRETSAGPAYLWTFTGNGTGRLDRTLPKALPDGAAVFALVVAQCPGHYRVTDPASQKTWALRSATVKIKGGTANLGLVVANATEPGHQAFAIAEAAVDATFFPAQHGYAWKELRIDYPATKTAYITAADLVIVDQSAWFLFDAVQHEIGHAFSVRHGIASGYGAPHDRVSHLAKRLGGTELGTAVALEEGFADFYAVMVQHLYHAAALDVPFVGDLLFTLPDPKTKTCSFGVEGFETTDSIGEDHELTATRIRWDLYDGGAEPGDAVQLGAGGLLKVLAGSERLSDLWAHIAQGRTAAQQDPFAEVFATHRVAPEPAWYVAPVLQAGSAFAWVRNGAPGFDAAGGEYRLDHFDLEVYDGTGTYLLWTRNDIAVDGDEETAKYVLTQGDVDAVNLVIPKVGINLALNGGSLRWRVVGRHAPGNVFPTGPYASPTAPLIYPELPLTFTADAKDLEVVKGPYQPGTVVIDVK